MRLRGRGGATFALAVAIVCGCFGPAAAATPVHRFGAGVTVTGTKVTGALLLGAASDVLSFDAVVPAGERLRIGTGPALGPGRAHVELIASRRGWRLALDGRPSARRAAAPLTIAASDPRVRVEHLLVGGRTREALLLHRLSALRAATPEGRIPRGEDSRGRLRFTRDWMMGFWAGALWRADDFVHGHRAMRLPALDATIATLGGERADTHDVGFIYGESSANAHDRLCSARRLLAPARTCSRLRRSALRAADTLMRLAASNAAAGTLPTHAGRRCRDCASDAESETIVDSVMNLRLLAWASRETGRPSYAAVARRAALGVARLLVRADGSTIQAVRFDRASGRVLALHTHQGLSADSTWTRGQAWAIHGFATLAGELADPELASVAQRTAEHLAGRLPSGRLPRWDLDASSGPTDASAAAIAAAGLFKLALLRPDDPRWRRLGERLLRSALLEVSPTFPLGRFGGQVYTFGGSDWDEDAEFTLGIDYALEAAVLSSAAARASRTATPQRARSRER